MSSQGGSTEGAAHDPLDLAPGTIFEGRYRLESQLGRGGFGAVYRATQLPVDRPVALKLLVAELAREPLEVRRFEQEARIIAALDHPHIVKLIELGQTEAGQLFLAMEFLEGASLAQVLRAEGALAPRRVQLLMEQVLDALAEAHDAGVVHRDLKLENLFLVRHPRRGESVKLLDFGIAKIPDSEEVLTAKGMLIGSPKTMAPEQILRQPVTPKTDLYAFGVVAYELLTGRAPFAHGTRYAIMQAHVSDDPPPPTLEGRPLTGPLVDLVMACLEKEPDARPASAHTLLAAWRAAPAPGVGADPDAATVAVRAPSLAEPRRRDATRRADAPAPTRPSEAPRVTRAAPAGPAPRRRLPWIMLGVALVVGAVVAIVVATSGGDDPPAVAAATTAPPALAAPPARSTSAPAPRLEGPCAGRMRDGFCIAPGFSDADGRRWQGIGAALWMMQGEVTTAEYKACVTAGACDGEGPLVDLQGQPNPGCHLRSGADAQPINCVSFDDAERYCRWIGARLPTGFEASREMADGVMTRKYPWGDAPPSCDETVMAAPDGTFGCGRGDTWAPCEHPRDKTPNGVCDLRGNLAEWLEGSTPDMLAQLGPEARLLTGGSMRVAAPDMFLTGWLAGAPRSARDIQAGFRCVRTTPALTRRDSGPSSRGSLVKRLDPAPRGVPRPCRPRRRPPGGRRWRTRSGARCRRRSRGRPGDGRCEGRGPRATRAAARRGS